ncbi:MAG: DUF4350 domain-containing protein [Acidobacteriota bacterium]|nr:DUF4350 domain-containing protein [Acidobacteriota bacterium]
MRGRLLIVLSFVVVLALLAGLNAVSYVRVEEQAELEIAPDRSTSNAGPTGVRALYEFLENANYRVARWRVSPAALLSAGQGRDRPATFVVIGSTRREYTEEDARQLLAWVSAGGRLVLIDRAPDARLLPTVENLRVEVAFAQTPPAELRADDVNAMTESATPLKPVQPTVLTGGVEQIAPSRFAGRVSLRPLSAEERKAEEERLKKESGQNVIADDEWFGAERQPPAPVASPPSEPDAPLEAAPMNVEPNESAASPTPVSGGVGPGRGLPSDAQDAGEQSENSEDEEATAGEDDAEEDKEAVPALAPVLHFADQRGGLVADYRHGAGRIVVLSDPFVVANNGLSRADNLQLALNLLGGNPDALIAFDEYHQGRGATHNQLAAYFAGTPVLAACGQLALLALAVVWSRGRRFARPLPAPGVDRRSKLEFVASMAELQQRARSYDLAIENVYTRTRRALARYGGTDHNVARTAIAERVAARSGLDQAKIEGLMRHCEDAINGQPLAAREALALVARLRELERTLGIRMRAREIKQAGAS